MAQYRVKEFAQFSRIKENTIRQHIKRGKLVMNDKKYIDDEHPINHVYINSLANGKGLKLRFYFTENNDMVFVNLHDYDPEYLKTLHRLVFD